MHFNQLFKRLWTHRIKLTVRLLICSLSLCCASFLLKYYINTKDVICTNMHVQPSNFCYSLGHIAKSATQKSFSHIFFSTQFFRSLSVLHRMHSAFEISIIIGSKFIIEFYGFRRPARLREWEIERHVYLLWIIDIVFICFRCQNRIFRDLQIRICLSVRICIASLILSAPISLRVIVIFVEYDFICRCHYAVSVAIYVATGVAAAPLILSVGAYAPNANCFPSCCFFPVIISIQMLRLPKRWKSDLPNTLSLSTL